jgi:hypothetical protein
MLPTVSCNISLLISSATASLHACNSLTLCRLEHIIFEVATKEICICCRWWPGPLTREALSKSVDSTGHGYQTRHAESSRRHLLYVSMHHPIGKMLCPHVLPGITSCCSCHRYRWFVEMYTTRSILEGGITFLRLLYELSEAQNFASRLFMNP